MSRPHVVDHYRRQLREAERLFDEGQNQACVFKAKQNIDEPDIPTEYAIRNYLLLACAVEGWDEGKGWILEAEMAYQDALWEARQNLDGRMLQLLPSLRKLIDQVDDWRLEDISGMTLEERIKAGWDEDMDGWSDEDESKSDFDEDETEIILEDDGTVTKAENETEAATSQLGIEDTHAIVKAKVATDVPVDKTHLEDAEAVAEVNNEIKAAGDQHSFDDAKAVPEAEKGPRITAEPFHIPIRTKVQSPSDLVTERAINTATTDLTTPPFLTASEPKNEHTIVTSD